MSRASRGRFVDNPSSFSDVAGSAGSATLLAEGAASRLAEVCVAGGLGPPSAVGWVLFGGVETPFGASPADGDAI